MCASVLAGVLIAILGCRTMTENEECEEFDPPTADRVAARAQVLITVAYRGILESSAGDPGAVAAHQKCIEWCERVGLRTEFEPDEWALLTTPLGELPRAQHAAATWRSESAACLAWALRWSDLPDYETPVDGAALSSDIGLFAGDAAERRGGAELRPRAALERLLDTYLAAHWRLREFSLRGEAIDFAQFAEQCAWTDMRIDELRLADGDLSIGGVPLAAATAEARQMCTSIVMERHRAAEWLQGQHPVWSEVTTDT